MSSMTFSFYFLFYISITHTCGPCAIFFHEEWGYPKAASARYKLQVHLVFDSKGQCTWNSVFDSKGQSSWNLQRLFFVSTLKPVWFHSG